MSRRVKYKKCPLVEVICQLRFPTILTLNATDPVEFQELIRNEFPLYNCKNEQKTEVMPNQEVRVSSNCIYEFISASTRTKVTITSSFIAFSTLEYDVWETFREGILTVLSKFESVYRIPFYTRTGLRYKDIITKSIYGFSNKLWSELIKPNVIGIPATIEDERMMGFHLDSEYKQPDKTYTHNMFSFVHHNGSPELSLLLDCDYYCKEIKQSQDVSGLLNTLHTHSSNFISNSITDELEKAMMPIEI